jgi:hypothetical protein
VRKFQKNPSVSKNKIISISGTKINNTFKPVCNDYMWNPRNMHHHYNEFCFTKIIKSRELKLHKSGNKSYKNLGTKFQKFGNKSYKIFKNM